MTDKRAKMDVLSNLLRREGGDKTVLFVTGAGLSVASGIPTYRGHESSTWSKFLYEWGTREKFLKDPLTWYNTFWLNTHHKREYLNAMPNRGHCGIGMLSQHFNGIRVVTQNIDGLHCKGKHFVREEQLIEIHGHLGKYKCINADCPLESETIADVKLEFAAAGGSTTNMGDPSSIETPRITSVPLCTCGEPLLPQALFFDEDYESHPFYQYEKVEKWLSECVAIVFVGTSFSVGITTKATREACRRSIPVFNFNLNVDEKFNERTKPMVKQKVFNVLGPCEDTLPILCQLSTARVSSRLYNGKISVRNGARKRSFSGDFSDARGQPSPRRSPRSQRSSTEVLVCGGNFVAKT